MEIETSLLKKRKAESQDVGVPRKKKKKKPMAIVLPGLAMQSQLIRNQKNGENQKTPPSSIPLPPPKILVPNVPLPPPLPPTTTSKAEEALKKKRSKQILDTDFVPHRNKKVMIKKFGYEPEEFTRWFSASMYRAYMLLCELMNATDGRLFNSPVDTNVGYTRHYYEIIKKPMDFGTIRRKMIQRKYKSLKSFKKDVDQVFTNCFHFNRRGFWVYIAGQKLKRRFNEVWNNKLEARKNDKIYLQKKTSRKHDPTLVMQDTKYARDIRGKSVYGMGDKSRRKANPPTLESIRERKRKEALKRKRKSSRRKKKRSKSSSSSSSSSNRNRTFLSSGGGSSSSLIPTSSLNSSSSSKSTTSTSTISTSYEFGEDPISRAEKISLLDNMRKLNGDELAVVVEIYRRKEGHDLSKEVRNQITLNFEKIKPETFDVIEYYVNEFLPEEKLNVLPPDQKRIPKKKIISHYPPTPKIISQQRHVVGRLQYPPPPPPPTSSSSSQNSNLISKVLSAKRKQNLNVRTPSNIPINQPPPSSSTSTTKKLPIVIGPGILVSSNQEEIKNQVQVPTPLLIQKKKKENGNELVVPKPQLMVAPPPAQLNYPPVPKVQKKNVI